MINWYYKHWEQSEVAPEQKRKSSLPWTFSIIHAEFGNVVHNKVIKIHNVFIFPCFHQSHKPGGRGEVCRLLFIVARLQIRSIYIFLYLKSSEKYPNDPNVLVIKFKINHLVGSFFVNLGPQVHQTPPCCYFDNICIYVICPQINQKVFIRKFHG